MSYFRTGCVVLATTLLSFGCGQGGVIEFDGNDDRAMTLGFATVFNQANKQDQLVDLINQDRRSISLEDLLSNENIDLPPVFINSVQTRVNWKDYIVSVPVGYQFEALKYGEPPLWLVVPDKDEDAIEQLEAFDSQGNIHILSADEPPDKPVITLIRDESLSMDEETPDMGSRSEVFSETDSVFTQKLDKVRFSNVHEPWFKGGAEIYLIVSYINKDDRGDSALIPLPGVTKKGITYNVNKVFHYWKNNRYQIIDIAFYEHDSGYNYKELAKIFIGAAATITGLVDPSAGAIVQTISTILKAVMDAVPNSFWTDDDDFMDTINTIQKYHNSNGILGVASNVNASLSTFEVILNDE